MPLRLRQIKKRAKDFGISLEEPRRGSHWKLRRGNEGVYPITAHNGLKSEIPDVYIRGLCNHFRIDLKEFKRGL